ncbi:MAG: pseudouridine-5'-phosphate glycosidase, partial [Candidatus Limnocylindria bacterium]
MSSPFVRVEDEVRDALDAGRAVVALESSLIAQGLPAPHNLDTALAAEAAVRESGAVPA